MPMMVPTALLFPCRRVLATCLNDVVYATVHTIYVWKHPTCTTVWIRSSLVGRNGRIGCDPRDGMLNRLQLLGCGGEIRVTQFQGIGVTGRVCCEACHHIRPAPSGAWCRGSKISFTHDVVLRDVGLLKQHASSFICRRGDVPAVSSFQRPTPGGIHASSFL